MKRLLITLLALTFTVGLFAQPKGYYSYRNEKYEYSVLIPECFDGMGESPSGDGQTFVSPNDEAHIQVYGGFNAQTLLGTSFDEEYQAKLKELSGRKVKLLDQGTMDDPDEEFDLAYIIEYEEDGLHHVLRSVWWGDRFATVDFWCYRQDWDRYRKDLTLNTDVIVYSLGPDDGTFHSESEKVLGWCSSEDYFLNVYTDGTLEHNGKEPSIADLFLSFAVSNQTPMTLIGMEKINDPGYEDDEIDEWILDNENDYFTMRMVSDWDYWMEACVFDKDNGHKLFVVNYNAPDQALMCFDYNPEEKIAHTDGRTLKLLQDMPKAIVRLPRQGKTMEVYYYKDLSKPVKRLTWNGKRFDVTD